MTRAALALLAALATLAASPDQGRPAALPVASSIGLPEPPMPPMHPPTDMLAPVPDDNLRAPLVVAGDDAQVKLRLFRMQRYDYSRGFLPGSRYESSEDRKTIQTPGLSLSVPLH